MGDFLKEQNDPNRPVPTETFESQKTITLGIQSAFKIQAGLLHPKQVFSRRGSAPALGAGGLVRFPTAYPVLNTHSCHTGWPDIRTLSGYRRAQISFSDTVWIFLDPHFPIFHYVRSPWGTRDLLLTNQLPSPG